MRNGMSVMFVLLALTGLARADGVPFSTSESSQYLLIGMGPVNDYQGQPGIGQAVNVNNFELGANKAPVPSTSDFPDSGGGPGLLGNVPDIPLNAMPVYSGICTGNVAITSPDGVYNLQDVGVYADLGIHTAQAKEDADAGTQNSFMNDPNQFPNTFVSSGFTNPGVNNNTGGTGLFVNPGDAVQSTRIDAPNYAGVTGNVDFTALLAELGTAATQIPLLAATGTLDTSGNGGAISADTTIMLAAGLNVIDIEPGAGTDFLLENSNLVIDGLAGAKAIFRVPDDANFLISNGNILVGNSGIGLESVLFFSDKNDNNAHFSFDNTVLNGVAFWTLANTGGEIVINNAQGCTQLVADKINLNDVRFCRCAFDLPELASIGDYVWHDLNLDGIQDPNEPGVDDVTVELFDSLSNPLGTTTTAGGGLYGFFDLLPGDYYLRFTPPPGFYFSPQDQGGDDLVDGDEDPVTGITIQTTLIAGENDLSWDAGLFRAGGGEPPIPEPAGLGLMGLALLAVRRRRG